MNDTLTTSALPAGNGALAQLRDCREMGVLSTDTVFSPGIRLNADPALGISGTWRSPPGRLLELEAWTSGPGDWCAVHVPLETTDNAGFAVLGFACRSAARVPVVIRPCLRSGTEDGFVDCFFDRHVLAHSVESLHVDALDLDRRLDVPVSALWREVVLFLPVHAFRISINDLRLFMA